MQIFIFLISVGILLALYKILPNKKFFPYFCILFCFAFCGAVYLNNKNAEQEKISQEKIAALQLQQKIFSDWYANYQKDIDTLDRIWKNYFDFVENVKSAKTFDKKFSQQIADIEIEAIDEQIKIHNLKIPEELDAEIKKILAELIRKTQIYSDTQVKIVSSVKNFSNPDSVKNISDLNKKIKNITIRESPAGLFTANEISAIREKFIILEGEEK